jgi:hypothetical protein
MLLLIGLTFLSSCEKKEVNPSITTLEANPTSASSCIAKAIINEFGTYAITDHGFVFYFGTNETLNYVNEQNKVSLGKDIPSETFLATLSLPNASSYYSSGYKWYVRSYITNEKGTVYGNPISFAPLVISLLNISPSTGKVGDTISINGNNFDPIITNNTVQFYYYYNYYTAKIVEASRTRLRVVVPSINSVYYDSFCDIKVTTGNQSSTLTDVFSFLSSVTGFSPKTGSFGTTISITGNFLGQTSVMFDNSTISYYSSDRTIINVSVPYTITSKRFKIYVVSGSTKMEVPGGEFVMNNLTATSFSPAKVTPGNSLTIYGSNFNSSSSYNAVFIGSTKISNVYAYSGSFSVTVPQMGSGNYNVSVTNGLDTVKIPGTLSVVTPVITGISPTSGYWGTDLTITGHNLNTNYSYVYFNNSSSTAYTYDSTTYKVKIPVGYTPGTYTIGLNNGGTQILSPTNFTILAPTLTSITPTNGTVGTGVIITGEGFGTSTSNVVVKFGSINATVSAVSNTQINAIVPSGIGGGAWSVSVTIYGNAIAKTLAFSVP